MEKIQGLYGGRLLKKNMGEILMILYLTLEIIDCSPVYGRTLLNLYALIICSIQVLYLVLVFL
ncbi:hypothetical protein CRYUN_Cryun20dG0039200 [Craigia yunnanensis]